MIIYNSSNKSEKVTPSGALAMARPCAACWSSVISLSIHPTVRCDMIPIFQELKRKRQLAGSYGHSGQRQEGFELSAV